MTPPLVSRRIACTGANGYDPGCPRRNSHGQSLHRPWPRHRTNGTTRVARTSPQTCRIWPPPSASAKMIESGPPTAIGRSVQPPSFPSRRPAHGPFRIPCCRGLCRPAGRLFRCVFACPFATGWRRSSTSFRTGGSTGDVPRSDDGLLQELLARRSRRAAEAIRCDRRHAGAAEGGGPDRQPAGHGEAKRALRRRQGHRGHRRRRICQSDRRAEAARRDDL